MKWPGRRVPEPPPPAIHDGAGRTVEILVEAIPAAVSLAPSGVSLGATQAP